MAASTDSRILHFYVHPGVNEGKRALVASKISTKGCSRAQLLDTELCFSVSIRKSGANVDESKLKWIMSQAFANQAQLNTASFLSREQYPASSHLMEFGPRLNFCTAFSTNAVSICHAIGQETIERIERSHRYVIAPTDPNEPFSDDETRRIARSLHDRMTECRYMTPITDFTPKTKERGPPSGNIDVLAEGRDALEAANRQMGLAFDEWDLNHYTTLFRDTIRRNPTRVECFDLAQSNSEHSRHWLFRGRVRIDGEEKSTSLMKMVVETQSHSNANNVVAFSDNSSAIDGYDVTIFQPERPYEASRFEAFDSPSRRHVVFTAETHNFPTGVAPFPGATTGTGGRIRDVQCVGRGAHVIAGTAGYCFGNLHVPGYELPWEDPAYFYPNNFASPLDVAIEASNGASDYGNKFGEPVLCGFARSFGLTLCDGTRREWVKPIMFSGGIGSMEAQHVEKEKPERGMEVVKLGGPAYRIGVGGGAASSVVVQGDNEEELDFGAVQRGDAEMEQKVNRAIRACIELRERNPICSIHDQGAGGNGNVLKEIVEPAGAVIKLENFRLGDPTLSPMEIWGAEYQESNALLVRSDDRDVLEAICKREKVPVDFVGVVTGDGKIVLEDGDEKPVDLKLEWVLGSMPRKAFDFERKSIPLKPLTLPEPLAVREALDRVLRLPSVASKRYLTTKVDRSVGGLVAQQQCVGPLHTPLADVAVVALSHFDTVGAATAIGEQPIKTLVDPAAGARMSVAEALTNLVFARTSRLDDVKCSANWMWPAKLPGEGATLYDACEAMCSTLARLGVAVDGGKDSLSMAARVGAETVKAPGALVVSAYVTCPDIRATVTPDLKLSDGTLLWVDLGSTRRRLGGTALAQVYGQIGDECPDLDDPDLLVNGFNKTQELIEQGLVVAGHDISDGGLVTCILEMAFAGNCGVSVTVPAVEKSSLDAILRVLFSEELGLVLEVFPSDAFDIVTEYTRVGVPCHVLGQSTTTSTEVRVDVGDVIALRDDVTTLRDVWEATSFQLDRLQCNPVCVDEERSGLRCRRSPPYRLVYDPDVPLGSDFASPRVAVVREEGSNGDREMAVALRLAGFDVWDVTTSDLCSGATRLDAFRGVVFVGGFSYADVFGSGKGWAATLRFNATARDEVDRFRARSDTFALGVCNGCQLMGLLGWVGDVVFTHNASERYESRFVTVKVLPSESMMLRGMEGSVLGVWVAHGEGRAEFREGKMAREAVDRREVPLVYVDDDAEPTMTYPLNPNGSPLGIAAMCSSDGRFLAMMPHPERTVLTWQWPWMPNDWRRSLKTSPWLRMFQNAFQWCNS